MQYRCKSCFSEYNAKRYASNPDKFIAYQAAYKAENPCAVKSRQARYYAENSERIKACVKAYREANPEKTTEMQAAYYVANREKVRALNAEWIKANPERNREIHRAKSSRRRALKKGAGGDHTASEVRLILLGQRGLCANCKAVLVRSGAGKYHVDHIVPIALGGTNDKGNLQCLCPSCNIRKSAKDPIRWANENGRLL